jgi:hypothetical protein
VWPEIVEVEGDMIAGHRRILAAGLDILEAEIDYGDMISIAGIAAG